MNSSAQSLPSPALHGADTKAEPSATYASKRRDYQVTNALGTVMATFDSEDLARSWVRRHLDHFPSLRVERVTVWIDRKVVYRPRVRRAMEQAA